MLGVEFDELVYKFSDGRSVFVEKVSIIDEGDDLIRDDKLKNGLRVRVIDENGEECVDWNPKTVNAKRKSSIDRYLPFLTRVGASKWHHDHTGETYDYNEIVEAYRDHLPESIRSGLWGDIPEPLLEITDRVDCRLIETQRLLVIKEDHEERYYRHNKDKRSTLAIMEKAQSLRTIISNEINSYAAFSQSLDRTFPRRVIQDSIQGEAEDLTAKLAELDQKRNNLMKAGILDTEVDVQVALPTGSIDQALARVLQTYAVDTQRKLETLDPLLARIDLFKDLIGQRFTTKNVLVDREHGFHVQNSKGEISLDKLSSGEQHQLVLFFELLFEIKENSLILIDEPELSLHVAWQKKFIGDLLNIITLNSFDVILATHSPQLISHWEDLVVELGDVFEGSNSARESDKEE